MGREFFIGFLALLLGGLSAVGQENRARLPVTLTRAQRWVDKDPNFIRWVGLAELRRAAGESEPARDDLAKAARAAEGTEQVQEVLELLAWRLLPVGQARREPYRKLVEQLRRQAPRSRWLIVHETYLALLDQDRTALLARAGDAEAPLPARFPTALAEQGQRALLEELGLSPARAGLEVLLGRSFDTLHALRDLDRGLRREADFLRGAGRAADADRLNDLRGRLALAYLASSRHLVERLFALNLLDRPAERDALLAQARAVPYLTDPQALARLFDRLDEDELRTRIIEPLLAGEVALIEQPPDLSRRRPAQTALRVESGRKSTQGSTTLYQDRVRARLAAWAIACDRLAVERSQDETGVLLTGSGAVSIQGVPGQTNPITADRFTFSSDTGSFMLGGDVRLHLEDRVLKLRACTITRTGAVHDPRSLLQDFEEAFGTEEKLVLLPRIMRTYSDDELPSEVRYLLALNLLRPHLTWHAPAPPPRFESGDSELREEQMSSDRGDHPWQEALGGEPWMLRDIPGERLQAAKESAEHYRRAWPKAGKLLGEPDASSFFWRIRDAGHPDVARVLRLLQGVQGGEPERRAQRWAAEIRRNNTVVTFDITGGYAAGKAAPLVVDVRNADRLAFKLYRIHKPEDLVWTADRIGRDFVYKDYGLQYGALDRDLKERMKRLRARMDEHAGQRGADLPRPEFRPEDLVHQWQARCDELKPLPLHRWDERYADDEEWERDDDRGWFGDECSRFQARIDKDYRSRQPRWSSWRCDRLVEVPAQALAKAGAYLLVAEANGQEAFVPIVVDPLSLTLRRCRDGVLAQVSDHEAKGPLRGARLHAKEMLGEAVTDAEGVAFVRVFAAGERALVASHEGRFAIGGFGRVFEGIYASPLDRLSHRWRDRSHRLVSIEARLEEAASVYRDRHLVAAYTDRPTYRPGQEVHFKLIVRRLAPLTGAEKVPSATAFRQEDFDWPLQLRLPDGSKPIPYAVLDPRGREVASGSLTLNDYGTAAGQVALLTEAVTGSYSLRIRLAGQDRIVPQVFGVRYYQRPTFEMTITGVPGKIRKAESIHLTVTGQYYFGKPVTTGTAAVRLVQPESWKPLAQTSAAIDSDGKSKLELALPDDLEGGSYLLLGSLTDDSGRTVTRSVPLEAEGAPAARSGKGLAALPRFVPVGQPLLVQSPAGAIVAKGKDRELTFKTKQGTARVQLPGPGWYHLRAGQEETDLFAYGGTQHPLAFPTREREQRPDDDGPRWVNLADYAAAEGGSSRHLDVQGHELLALFDQQHAVVGEKLRLLVWSPRRQARVLFTYEGRTVLDYHVVALPESQEAYHVVEVPIRSRHLPNFYLQGRILGGEQGLERARAWWGEEKLRKLRQTEDGSEDPRWCRIDVVDPRAQPGTDRLKVVVEPDGQEYRPGDPVQVRLKVTDLRGQPRAAEVSLSAVDESVYVFGADGVDGLSRTFGQPHEPRRFFPKSWRSCEGNKWAPREAGQVEKVQRMQEMLKQLTQVLAASKSADAAHAALDRSLAARLEAVPLTSLDGELPASRLSLARLRGDFRETAAWQPQLRTGPDGTAQTSFRLPDSLTRYRLTAVALTRDAEIGVGRAQVRASLPLAVQLIVPRFAVEKDRLLAIGLIHNNTARERTVQVRWEVQAAQVEGPAPGTERWQLREQLGEAEGLGQVVVPAHGTARAGVWLRLVRIGTVRLAFRAGDASDRDAETRSLPIRPLGRPREITQNGTLHADPPAPGEARQAGVTRQHARWTLPPGFIAQDVQLTLSCTDVAQSLDGLGYLVEYPYGCIEQTMSRFLPAVMVQHAIGRTSLSLPPEVAARLPDVMAKGLARVYGFQHADGSWGWFARDARNVPMTVCVLYGLARCQGTGMPVDRQVLDRGCTYLRQELRGGQLDAALAARAWYVLALAGQAEASDVADQARQALLRDPSFEACANLALACRVLGRSELGERLWTRVRGWRPADAEHLALLLQVQIAFGASWNDCRLTSRQLLALRKGDRWEHTRATAGAIEALAEMLRYVPERTVVKRVQARVGGKSVLDVTGAAQPGQLTYRVRRSGEQLPAEESLAIELAAECAEPMQFTLRATGVQRLDRLEPAGTRVRIRRLVETLDGKPLSGPVAVGQVLAVRLRVALAEPMHHLIVEDPRPAGCEFADERLEGLVARSAAHIEFRDDRVCVFHTSLPSGVHEMIYYLRAETPGTSHVLPGCVYPMYADQLRGETGSLSLIVQDRP